MTEPAVLVEMHGATALITLNRPQRRNALDTEMRDGMRRAVEQVRDDAAVRAVVLYGAGGAFCAGGDLRAMAADKPPAAANRERIRALHLWFRDLVNLEKPVVAAVDGPAFGAGFNLALAADFILCSREASFCAAFAKVGLVPDLAGLYLLPRILGLQRAKEIVFSARTIDAAEAMRLGIAYAVRPAAGLVEDAIGLAARFHAASPEALAMAKAILNQSFHLDQHAMAELEAFAQAVCMDSAYHRTAIARFLAKEPLRFDWKPGFD
jgi:2-(1,2-epoxy-1,2-dihydrophenyl)acetyl-CoA isomerase